MASPPRPSRFALHDEEAVQKKAAAKFRERSTKDIPERLCRTCGTPLTSGAEYRLGIHVRCVYNITQRSKTFKIPRPRYGQ